MLNSRALASCGRDGDLWISQPPCWETEFQPSHCCDFQGDAIKSLCSLSSFSLLHPLAKQSLYVFKMSVVSRYRNSTPFMKSYQGDPPNTHLSMMWATDKPLLCEATYISGCFCYQSRAYSILTNICHHFLYLL